MIIDNNCSHEEQIKAAQLCIYEKTKENQQLKEQIIQLQKKNDKIIDQMKQVIQAKTEPCDYCKHQDIYDDEFPCPGCDPDFQSYEYKEDTSI